MKSTTKVLLVIAVVLGLVAAAEFFTDVFSTKLNKYYKVEGR